MSESVVNTKQIAKNTIVLYIRMAFVMIVGLYSVRAFLDILGASDYGLYNVVGGVVSMLSFLNGTLATSSQRFFSIALVQKNADRLNKVFCLNQSVYIIIIIICVILLETLGLWYVNNGMTIPEGRQAAVNIVYQLSIISMIPQMLAVSYYALIIAREQMKVYAYIGILDAALRLAYVFILKSISCDKLISFASLMMFSQFFILFIYMNYCKKRYDESHYHFVWDKKEILEILGFSGWHLFGTMSVVIRGNGINLLINSFFNPVVNAARAIAFQFQNAITQLTQSFFKAVIPQMYKSYANNEIKELHGLIMRSTLICFFLTSLFSIPLFFNAEFVLNLWLKETPAYALAFAQLVLINCLIDSVADSTICPALATGNIKKFYLVTGTIYILSLPIAYIFLKLGCEPTSTMVVSIGISVICLFARAWLLIDLIDFPLKEYLMLCGKIAIVTMVIGSCIFVTSKALSNKWATLVVTTIVSSLLHCVMYLYFVCSQQDKDSIIRFVNNKFHRNGNQK